MQTSSIIKGAAIGIAAGCVGCWLTNTQEVGRRHHKKVHLKKKAENAFRTVGCVMDEFAQMMK